MVAPFFMRDPQGLVDFLSVQLAPQDGRLHAVMFGLYQRPDLLETALYHLQTWGREIVDFNFAASSGDVFIIVITYR